MFLFLFLPYGINLAIHLIAALLPAGILLNYIYKNDTFEKEPRDLIVNLLFLGVASAFVAIAFEIIGTVVLNISSQIGISSEVYAILTAFFVVAVVEEGAKFFFLKLRTWKDPNFNYRFDAIVYAACVSLGFAAFENVKYVFSYGLLTAIPRGFLSIPGHLGFSVIMGYFYGRAKICERNGDESGKNTNLVLSWVCPVLMHGFYDACLMIGKTWATLVFLVFVVVMYIVIMRLVRRESLTNEPV